MGLLLIGSLLYNKALGMFLAFTQVGLRPHDLATHPSFTIVLALFAISAKTGLEKKSKGLWQSFSLIHTQPHTHTHTHFIQDCGMKWILVNGEDLPHSSNNLN